MDYDKGFGEGNGEEMGIFLLENRLGREGDRINVGLALIYMGLIDVLLELIDIG